MDNTMDIVICIVPKINPDAPTVGPAVLKAHCESAGFSCKVVDFNIRLFNALETDDRNYYFEDDSIFRAKEKKYLTDEFEMFYNKYKLVFDQFITELAELKPKFVGLSLLSDYSTSVAIKLSYLIKENLPNIKIIWGGAAIDGYVRDLQAQNLIDHYVRGDGEHSLINLLQGNTDLPGINNFSQNQILDLNSILFPNYDDIKWNEYYTLKEPRPVYITGSRGCVKRCTFCSVADIWPDYKFRQGSKIANEIISVKERYNRHTFKFTDSLINGSMKAFRELLTELTEYRKTETDFRWTSQWIIRSKHQSPELDYIAMKESGCSDLEIGIESFSQDVRWHMGKKFTDEDMWWCLDMLSKYNISASLLLISGYPTETEEDHINTLEKIKLIYQNGYNNQFHLSFSLMLLDHWSPLWNIVKDDITDYKNIREWTYKDNTPEVRIRRYTEILETIKTQKNAAVTWLSNKELNNYQAITE
jgi:anaerobic magnesium-protoporphyrin IX monomethyl ester cyclase